MRGERAIIWTLLSILILYEHLQQQDIHVVADRTFQTLRAHIRYCYRRILERRIFAVFYGASGDRGRKRTVRRVRLRQTALARTHVHLAQFRGPEGLRYFFVHLQIFIDHSLYGEVS